MLEHTSEHTPHPSHSLQSLGFPSDIAQQKFESPRQPALASFPLRVYGSSKRSFQASWYNDFPWLEYSIERDAVFFRAAFLE